MTCQMRCVPRTENEENPRKEKMWNYLPLTLHIHHLTQRSSAFPVSERSRVPVVWPKKCVGDSDAFATLHLTGHYAHKLIVMNDEGVYLGGDLRGE